MTADKLRFSLVVASSLNGAIGRQGQLPWHLKGDLKYFQQLTTETTPGKQNAVIMGRKTWESIPEKYQPLNKRFNIVLTSIKDYRTPKMDENCRVSASLNQALDALSQRQDIDKIFIVGGSGVYTEAMNHPQVEYVYLTRVMQEFQGCDAFFDVDSNWSLMDNAEQDQLLAAHLPRQREDGGIKYEFQVYRPLTK